MRDHTTDQLNPEGDEYIPREWDEQGEQKVTLTGHLHGGREYRCRTFKVPLRGDKLFMLATECARVLVYRDSYLLFNKNKSLHKIIANQTEKEDLIAKDILPYSYRSRQIAMVTARSMFRQFGAKMIVEGRRVRDDYWEQKARKQGFTEEDLASEKRPAANKPKETPAEPAAANTNALNILANNRFEYQDLPGRSPYMTGLGISGFNPTNQFYGTTAEDMPPRDYGNVHRPRQDMAAAPYQDRSQPSATNEVVNQAAQASEFNKSLAQQRDVRSAYLHEAWNRKHEVTTPPLPPEILDVEDLRPPQAIPGQPSPPQMRNVAAMQARQQQAAMMQQQQQAQVPQQQQQTQQQQHRRGSSAMMTPQAFQQNQQMAQSPAQRMPHPMTPGPMGQNRPQNFPYDMSGQGTPSMYGFPNQNQMYGQQAMGQQQMAQQFAGHQGPPQQSPQHMQQSPHHMAQSGPMGMNNAMAMGGMNYMGMGGAGQAGAQQQNFAQQMRGGQPPGGMFPGGQGGQFMGAMSPAGGQQGGGMPGWSGMQASGGQQGWTNF